MSFSQIRSSQKINHITSVVVKHIFVLNVWTFSGSRKYDDVLSLNTVTLSDQVSFMVAVQSSLFLKKKTIPGETRLEQASFFPSQMAFSSKSEDAFTKTKGDSLVDNWM